MGIIVERVRIKNFRSIADLSLSLSQTNVLIGANNSGKSNFLEAINLALGQRKTVSIDDIYVANNEILEKSKSATIDIMLRPIDNRGNISPHFSDFWLSTFTEAWVTTGDPIGDYVGIRTTIQYDTLRSDYILIRKQIKDWGTSIDTAQISGRKAFTADMNEYIFSFYMNAQRDAVEDIRDRKSYFGRATTAVDLSAETISSIEQQLDAVNTQIVSSIPALNQTTTRLSAITSTMDTAESVVSIEPLARKISDLHKGIDIVYQDGNAAKMSISQHGMGTRSWVSFLTLGAYIDWFRQHQLADDPESDIFIMLTMEEPEAHLHPQAQRKLYGQLCNFSGQRIVSTHSANIVAQAELNDLIHFEKVDGKTTAHRFNASQHTAEDIRRIRREVISSHGELLFSKAIVLCEGITEEQALPVFYRAKFGVDPVFNGINIIGIGGQNYRTFLSLIKDFNLRWYIFSDGETETIRTVSNAVQEVFGQQLQNCPNVIVLDNGENYERHLLNNGYENEIVSAIEELESDPGYVARFIQTRDQTSRGRMPTNQPPCPQCHQPIYQDIIRNYSGTDGYRQAIFDCCTSKKAKAKYAIAIAEKIVSMADETKRFPPKVACLMTALEHLN